MASEKRLQEEVSELTQNLRKKEKDLETAQKRAAGLSDDEISAQLAAEKKLNEQIKEELQVTLIMICSGGLFISFPRIHVHNFLRLRIHLAGIRHWIYFRITINY